MSTPLPPIYRDIRRLLVHTEEMVRRFARYHKYTVGTDLRTQAMRLMRGVNRACFDTAQQAQHVQALVWLVDDYKLTLQLCMEVGTFKNAAKGQVHFNQFEEAANLAAQIGKQCGGWQQKTANRLRAQVDQSGAADVPSAGSRVKACGNPAGQPRFTECLHRLFAVRGYTMIKPLGRSCFVGARFIGRSRFIAQQVALLQLQRRFLSNGLFRAKSCYPSGCLAAPQVCRLAFWSASPNVGNSNNAWNVNFNNGNVNNNNRNNSNYVRLVRAGEWSVTR